MHDWIERQRKSYGSAQSLKRVTSALMVSVVFTACSQDVTSPPPNPAVARSEGVVADSQQVIQQAATERTAAAQGRQLRGIEDDILRLEGYLPGFGGLFIDSTGHVAVYAPANANADSVRAILAQHDTVWHLREPFAHQMSAGNQVHVLTGQYPFSYLVVWARMFSTQLRADEGIVSVDADEAHNRVSIGVSDTGATSTVLAMAAGVGIPTGVIRVNVTEPRRLLSTLQDPFSTRVGGIQIWTSGFYGGTCTLGFNATTSTGITGFITASHCSPYSLGAGGTGATVYQNGSSWPVGTIVNNPAWNIVDPTCGSYSGAGCTYADVMMVKYNTGIANQKWVMYTTSVGTGGASGSITTAGTYQVNATTFYPVTGDVVDKMGRTTGWTRGTISNTCQTVLVINSTTGQSGVVLCSNQVTGAHSDAGDSGGPVFNQQFGLTFAYGLLFAGAGTTYNFEGFQAMQRMLGVTPVVY